MVLFGFELEPTTGSFDFTGLVVDVAGTATSSDLSNFEIVYDADGDGVVDGGESVVSDTKAIGATITFVMSGQTGLGAARNYLLIADVAAAPAFSLESLKDPEARRRLSTPSCTSSGAARAFGK